MALGLDRRRDGADLVPVRLALATLIALAAGATPAVAQTVTLKPLVDARLRYEHVDQDDLNLDADAITLRVRAGVEARVQKFSLLVEAEGTLAIDSDYNAFPFAVASPQRRPGFSTVADPETVELNRFQLQYKGKAVTLTAGRQRINLDDQRWIGNGAPWRQNDLTYDAARAEAKFGPVTLDGAYSWSERSVFGVDAGPRQALSGDFVMAGAGAKLGPVQVKAFAYLLDFNEAFVLPLASQTYGARATASFPLTAKTRLALTASYARQSDYKANPFDFAADYLWGDAAVSFGPLTLGGGWEKLGSDPNAAGGGRAVQTPFAALHKFNGWADQFLTTPARGLQDAFASASFKFDKVKALPGLTATVVYHQYDSDVGDVEYGTEWDALVGFKRGRIGWAIKYADYDALGFATDTRKLWLQMDWTI